ncbi:MAG: UPF0149 family protein [Gammaproteobacteria bacterium]|nr:UPF0149 family protein [Gammaproteobacteria bacterium]
MHHTLHHTPESLSDRERKFIAGKLLEYGNDESVLDFSELDGFLTAIVTHPEMLPMSVWYPALWGGESLQPDWQSEEELERFLDLLLQHLTSIAAVMLRWPDEFAAHFNQVDTKVGADEGKLLSAEEWCFGYLRGVTAAGGWTDLPAHAQEALDCIRLHCTEERLDEWEALTPEEQQNSIRKIEPAVRQLYAAWRR